MLNHGCGPRHLVRIIGMSPGTKGMAAPRHPTTHHVLIHHLFFGMFEVYVGKKSEKGQNFEIGSFEYSNQMTNFGSIFRLPTQTEFRVNAKDFYTSNNYKIWKENASLEVP